MTVFGFVAPNKGYEAAFEAMKRWPNDICLLIAGGARNEEMIGYETTVHAIVKSRGLESRVQFTGHLSEEDIADAMAATDLAATPHTQATGSYSVMVPLSYGKAVAASDLACFREIREQSACIELFRAGDASEFARVVSEILGDSGRRAGMEQAALEFARAHSWREAARRTVEVYREGIADEMRLRHHAAAG